MPVKRTPEGFLHIPAKIARTGIQDYLAGELRRAGVPLSDSVPGNAIVRIYRDAAEVFDAEALASFEHKPTTLGHPVEDVNPENVRQLQTGFTKAPVTADGDHVSVEVVLQSADAIKAYNQGIRDLSCGYRCGVVMTPGITADGQPYDGRQTKIIGNHVAQLRAGRAGSAKLGDGEKTMNEEERKAYETALRDSAKLAGELAEMTKERDRLAGEVTALKASALTDEAKAKLIDEGVAEQLKAIAERAAVIDRAKKFAPALAVTDAMTTKEIQIAALKARDSKTDFADKSDDFVAGMFATLSEPTRTKDAAPTKTKTLPKVVSFETLRKLKRG